MTPGQVFIVSVLGGLSAVIGLAAAAIAGLALWAAISRLSDAARAALDWHRRRRQRHSDRRTCAVLESMQTVNHPKE